MSFMYKYEYSPMANREEPHQDRDQSSNVLERNQNPEEVVVIAFKPLTWSAPKCNKHAKFYPFCYMAVPITIVRCSALVVSQYLLICRSCATQVSI